MYNRNPFCAYLQQTKIVRLNITCKLTRPCHFPAFKGSMLHGWFGHVLMQSDAELFHLFYGEHAGQQPKPYAIIPSDDRRTHWHANEFFSFQIVLLGDAVQAAQVVCTALSAAMNRGFNSEQSNSELLSINSQVLVQQRLGIQPYTLWDAIEHRLPCEIESLPICLPLCEVHLSFTTPLRMKFKGTQITTAPLLPLLLKQIERRLRLLGLFWVDEQMEQDKALDVTQLPLGDYQLISHLYNEQWARYSKKEQRELPFGGLKGRLIYQGEIASALPWLIIGNELGIGGKTSFGLGQYQLCF